MVNHVRTLLGNTARGAVPEPDFPGEELIPAGYAPVRFGTALQTVRRVLFGADPDRLFLAHRLAQLMALLHSTELETHVLDYDPRITYGTADLTGPEVFADEIVPMPGTPEDSLFLLDAEDPPDVTGRCERTWRLRISVPGTLSISRGESPATVSEELTDLGGLSAPVPLPGSPRRIRTTVFALGSGWRVVSRSRPRADLSEVAENLAALGEPTLLALFGLEDAEPWNTYRNLWQRHPELPYRLGGLVLALAARTELLRRTAT